VDSVLFDPDYQIISGHNFIDNIRENPLQSRLKVFPNPASEKITFMSGLYPGEDARIIIYDQYGCLNEELQIKYGEKSISCDTRNYPDGLYFYRFIHENSQESGKFIIHHIISE
jgi:hypothetical protein